VPTHTELHDFPIHFAAEPHHNAVKRENATMRTRTLVNGTQPTGKRWVGKTMTGLMLALLCLLSLAQPARANTIIVNSTADDGPGTLREALASATDGDTIDASGLNGTIVLTTGELVVSNSVTIKGQGALDTVVDGDNLSRVFHVYPSKTVTFANLGITKGADSVDVGAGILGEQADVTLTNCYVHENLAYGGGGIFALGGSLTVIESFIDKNKADYGAAVAGFAYNGDVSVSLKHTQVVNNEAASNGGGVWVFGNEDGDGNLAIVSGSIQNNKAGSSGGGIYQWSYLSKCNATIDSCFIGGNSANSLGGGLYSEATYFGINTTVVKATTFAINSASDGAGIFNHAPQGNATLLLSSSTLYLNAAQNDGGAIANAGPLGLGNVTVNKCTFLGNTAGARGGGIFNDGEDCLAALAVNASTFSKNSAAAGGTIFVKDANATLLIADSIFNAGSSGGTLSNESAIVTSYGFNLSSDDGAGLLTAATDLINTDPQLGTLQSNGGPTPTIALGPNSPAIDQGQRGVFAALSSNTDQRGFPRPLDDPTVPNAAGGDGSDIGAYEVQNLRPVAKCKNVTVPAGAGCMGSASIDDGSFDPDGGLVTLSQSPAGPYSVGTQLVTLTVTDSQGATNGCTATVTVVPSADLLISKAVVSGTAKPGQSLVYTVTVQNLGACAATGVAVNDPVPAGTTFYAVTTTQGTTSAPPVGTVGTVTANFGTLASGASATMTLTVKVSAKGNDKIVNTATVTATTFDPNVANNTATIISTKRPK
jgi:uncharacterized repeat protein (TIGR01451 family)